MQEITRDCCKIVVMRKRAFVGARRGKQPSRKNTRIVKCTRAEKRALEHKLRGDGEVRGGETIDVKDWGGGC